MYCICSIYADAGRFITLDDIFYLLKELEEDGVYAVGY